MGMAKLPVPLARLVLAPSVAPPIVGAMIKRALLISWLGLQCLPALAQAQTLEPVQTAVGAPIQAGVSYTLHSSVLADDREINIWLPPNYEQGEGSYTVLYLLDGALDQDFQHIVGLAQLGSLSWTFGPLIVVGVQTENRRAELTDRPTDPRYLAAFPESGGAGQFRRFLETEVMPFVEQRFGAGGRRALMGESLAGLFVIDTLLTQPSLFDDYIAVSPSLWWDDRRPLQHAGDRLADGDANGRRLYVAMADEGGTMQDGLDILRRALGDVPEAKIAWRYADHSATATHATIYHSAAEEALRWLYPAPPYDAGPTPWYMIEGAAPPASQPKP